MLEIIRRSGLSDIQLIRFPFVNWLQTGLQNFIDLSVFSSYRVRVIQGQEHKISRVNNNKNYFHRFSHMISESETQLLTARHTALPSFLYIFHFDKEKYCVRMKLKLRGRVTWRAVMVRKTKLTRKKNTILFLFSFGVDNGGGNSENITFLNFSWPSVYPVSSGFVSKWKWMVLGGAVKTVS